MIKFIVVPLPKSKNEYDFNDLHNKRADDFAAHNNVAHKDMKCETHGDYNNTVTIIAKATGFEIERTDFCCSDFSERITFE